MKPTDLGCVWFCGGITGWVYRSLTDKLETIKEPGYFDRMSGMANVGDQIYIVATDGVGMFYISKLTPRIEIKEL